ncbi:MAG: hypothetical protein H6Q90_1257 [Deltaproteobacteria bacterium]|nr:hypothetical protein [Deltaproteobacteria bacterium]
MRSNTLVPLLLVCVALGCASSTRQTTLSRANIGTKYARQTGYFASCGTRCDEEQTRGGIRHDVILDEIVLAKVTPQETCFDVTLRTEESKDEPFTELHAECEMDGSGQQVAIEDELVSAYDFAYTGQREVAVVEGIAAAQYIGMSLSAPAEQVFRVIHRKGTLCCPKPATTKAVLRFRNPHFDFGVSKGRLEMIWNLGA